MALSEITPAVLIGAYFLGTLLFAVGSALRNDKLRNAALGLAGLGFALQSLDLVLLASSQDISLASPRGASCSPCSGGASWASSWPCGGGWG